MMGACEKAGTPFPKFDCEQTGLWTVFRFPGQTPVETPVKTPEKILAVLQQHPEMSLAEVAQEIGRSLRAVERACAVLVKDGRLRYIGPKKNGHWEVLK